MEDSESDPTNGTLSGFADTFGLYSIGVVNLLICLVGLGGNALVVSERRKLQVHFVPRSATGSTAGTFFAWHLDLTNFFVWQLVCSQARL